MEMEIFRDESAPTSSPSSTMPCPLPVARGEDLSSTPGGFRGADGTIFRHDHLFVAGVQSQTSRSVVSPRESHRSEPPNGDGSGDNSSRGRTGQSSPSTPSISDTFSIFHLNPQGIGTAAKQAEFDTLLQHYQHPTIVGVTETWLTRTTESLTFSGYKRVSRLDRRVGRPDRGGIALFALDSFAENVVHIGDSPVDERSWHIIHCDCGPVLLCLWYRPPNRDEIESIQRFEQELSHFSRDTVAVIVVGDMNVHNAEWLRYSRGSSREGTELETVCCTHGLRQHVKDPTRGPHLLDLVLSNFSSGIRCKVVPGVKDDDHEAVLTTVNVTVPSARPVRRQVFDYKKANWNKLKSSFSGVDWGEQIRASSADDAAAWVTAEILRIVDQCIPSKWITDKSYAHPWINDECREALRRKHEAKGTDNYAVMRDSCSELFLKTYRDYVLKTRETLKTMDPSSRGWWKVANTLLTKASTSENIPALQRADGSWAMTPEERANELASTFREKSRLPPEQTNNYTEIQHEQREPQRGFLRLRVRTVRKLLKKLDESSGTGPDRLPARILKRCAAELALPVTLLSRKLLAEGRWPQCWRTHWVHAIHKRKSRADAKNYRGVHLTAQLSKIVERAIGSTFLPWVEANELYGPNQFAYGKGKGYKDTLCVNVCEWLLLMEKGFLVGLYCSDVSGAFDRVDKTRLEQKLRATGLHPRVVALLVSWLDDRVSRVVVAGRSSPEEPLTDSVFQGTVLGPPLWNLFYEDARLSVHAKDFLESVFADDFNCWKAFQVKHTEVEDSQAKALSELQAVQAELHWWGEANRVLFDPSKESFHLLHRRFFSGDDFKLLGVVFDPQLLMHRAAREVATEAGWRLQTLLKVRRFFTTPELFRMYKAQVLSYVESGTPALYHAARSVLDRVDRVQRRFLRELDYSEKDALVDYRLAPLDSRRDMAMLAVLHKVTLGTAPAKLKALFPPKPAADVLFDRHRLRGWRPPHDKQLYTECTFQSTDVLQNSLFGLVHCYNRLPPELVAVETVKGFQRQLQGALRKCAESGLPEWNLLYSSAWKRLPLTNFDAFFRS